MKGGFTETSYLVTFFTGKGEVVILRRKGFEIETQSITETERPQVQWSCVFEQGQQVMSNVKMC